MFSFGRDETTDVTPFIRRIIDLSTPNLTLSHDSRLSRRYNRCLPVVFSPWTRKGYDPDQIGIGVTSDLSDNGMSLITQAEMIHKELVIAFFLEDAMDSPWYFKAVIRSNKQLLAEFNKVGLRISEFLNADKRKLTESFDETVYSLLRPEVHSQ